MLRLWTEEAVSIYKIYLRIIFNRQSTVATKGRASNVRIGKGTNKPDTKNINIKRNVTKGVNFGPILQNGLNTDC